MTRSILIYPDTLGIVLEADLPDVEAVVPGLAAAPHAVEGEASQVAADAQPEVVPCPLVNREIVTVSTLITSLNATVSTPALNLI